MAIALKILSQHKVEIEEYKVEPSVIQRLGHSCLLSRDVDNVKKQAPIRPQKWHDYIYEQNLSSNKVSDSLAHHYPISMPFSLIDQRIMDLAIDFPGNEDFAIISAFRRLEDLLRKRTGLSGEGAKLFTKAFLAEGSLLHWDVEDEGEAKGRANLFIATYMAYRNARVHREYESSEEEALREFLIVNQLYKLEAASLTEEELKGKTN